jgi:hypothetical protein
VDDEPLYSTMNDRFGFWLCRLLHPHSHVNGAPFILLKSAVPFMLIFGISAGLSAALS